ncbi:DNA methyltransferase, partial [Helicobacter vulpis]|uniref:DNA methyltransferase n=1 Tax=Helicobacter vulpis TaxID=2316076 RepID=UPI0013CE1F3E
LEILPRGSVVLDCFSGSTGVACAQLGLDFIGVEKSPEYAKIAKENLAKALDLGLFNASRGKTECFTPLASGSQQAQNARSP